MNERTDRDRDIAEDTPHHPVWIEGSGAVGPALDAALSMVQDAMLVVQGGEVVAHNRRFCEIWGLSGSVPTGTDVEEFLERLEHRLKEPTSLPIDAVRGDNPAKTPVNIPLDLKDGRTLEAWRCAYPVSGESLGQVWAFREVTRRRDAQHKVWQATDELRRLVPAPPVAMIAVDRSGKVTTWNPAAEVIFDIEAEHAIGASVTLLDLEDREGTTLADHVAQALKGRSADRIEFVRSGQTDPGRFTAAYSPLSGDGGPAGAIIVASRTPTDQALLEEPDRQRRRYETWVEVAPDVALTLDVDGRISSLNPAFERISGWEAGDWLGRPFTALVHPDDEDEVLDAYQAALDGREPSPVRFRYQAADDAWRWGLALGRPVMEGGLLQEIFVIVRDITEERVHVPQEDVDRYRMEVRRLRDQARQRQALMATSAHELAKPLTPMRFQVAILEAAIDGDRFDQETVEQVIAILGRGVQRLSRLVEDLGRAACAEGQAIRLVRKRVALGELVEEMSAAYQAVAQDQGVEFDVDVEEPAVVHVDPQRIQQVVANLLDNAIRFSEPSGRVHVLVDRVGGRGRVRVRDLGPGLTRDQIADMFQPFSQVHEGAEEDPGSGLGLYVARSIVEGHGGELWCQSPGPGEGTVFHVELPLADAE